MTGPLALDLKLWCCPDCGSPKVQVQVWIDANTDDVVSSCESYHWCNYCEDQIGGGETKGLECLTWRERCELRAAFLLEHDITDANPEKEN
jgi:hypothetical protein